MNEFRCYCNEIDLHVAGRIAEADARRQEATAREILRRLHGQPGLILADEVGMGKTFVALAVAVSVALNDRRPVVIMTPPSLKEKWPRELETFRNRCLPRALHDKVRHASAVRAVDFLKLLDDPKERKKQILFVTHGAMSRGLNDPWVKLAVVAHAIGNHDRAPQVRKRLALCLKHVIRGFPKAIYDRPELVVKLLASPCGEWLGILREHEHEWRQTPDNARIIRLLVTENPKMPGSQAYGRFEKYRDGMTVKEALDAGIWRGDFQWDIDHGFIQIESDPCAGNSEFDDDPVPNSVVRALQSLELESLWQQLRKLPQLRNEYYEDRAKRVGREVEAQMREVWKACMARLRLRLPLLILDEAHHLKNRETELARLFQIKDAQADAQELDHGVLAGAFERIVFLTATPFQLGHGELCSVLDRFCGIRWRGREAPEGGLAQYQQQLEALRAALDHAQQASMVLDAQWGRLTQDDLMVGDEHFEDAAVWWEAAQHNASSLTPCGQHVMRCYADAQRQMRKAEALLRPWVIRHLRSRHLPEPHTRRMRRARVAGAGIVTGNGNGHGLHVDGPALLPFLLAARAASLNPTRRPVFAEGLASSYEAFLHTRMQRMRKEGPALDEDDSADHAGEENRAIQWYMQHLEEMLPAQSAAQSLAHPKVNATVQRVLQLWQGGEKVVVFCHYVQTGRVLRQHISECIRAHIHADCKRKMPWTQDPEAELERLGNRFFDLDSPVSRACAEETGRLLQAFPALRPWRDDLEDVVRRYVRTPSFLVRYFPLAQEKWTEEHVRNAFIQPDESGLTLEETILHFFRFLQEREQERDAYIAAVKKVQTGSHRGADAMESFGEDERTGGAESLMPNVRLVNGATADETRRRLMLTFNTPFYPEVLIASSVLAEGVDLHLNCRHIIHHDLCWNPSTLEQRTGRVDRIGAKAERCGQPIHVYLPYVAETQDEKMYRVVMDRERWFSVVMGDKFKVNAHTTDKLAARVPLPESAAHALAFRLEVHMDNAAQKI